MRRRDLAFIAAGVAAAPLIAFGQQQTKPTVGLLSSGSPGPYSKHLDGFRQGLREFGFVEDQNLAIEYRWAEGQYDRLPGMAADLVSRQVALIAAMTIPAAKAAKSATATIPIAFYYGGDPVQAGLVASFARPGGNLTGVSSLNAGLNAKRLGLLRELVPTGAVFGLLINPTNANAEFQSNDALQAGREIAVRIVVLNASSEHELDGVFAIALPLGGLIVGADPFFNSSRNQLIALATKHTIPTIYADREFTVAGGLMSYGNSLVDTWHRVGTYAGKILADAKPADLPIQQPTKFELVINLKTAKALGLAVPSILLAQADEVIE